MTATATRAVATPTPTRLTPEQLRDLLRGQGWSDAGNSQPRMKLNGNTIETSDGGMFLYNPKKPDIPALTVRIVKPLQDYNGFWITKDLAEEIGHPEAANTYSKKWHTPDASRRVWQSDLLYDKIKDTGEKPTWRGELEVQIVPDDGIMTGQETTYVFDLSTTSVVEWKGTSSNPEKGAVSDTNFINRLCEFAQDQAIAAGIDPTKAVLDALTSLSLGGVVAEIRVLKAENDDKSRTWSVVSFTPIHIEPMEADASRRLESGASDEDPAF